MSSNTLAGIPFALVCVGIVVYAAVLLVGTLSSMDGEASETNEEGRCDIRAVLVGAVLLLALLARYGR